MGCILWKALSRLRRAGLSSISPKIYSLRCSCSRNCRMSLLLYDVFTFGCLIFFFFLLSNIFLKVFNFCLAPVCESPAIICAAVCSCSVVWVSRLLSAVFISYSRLYLGLV